MAGLSLDELVKIARSPSTRETRKKLALCALECARDAFVEGHLHVALMFLDDAQAHIREMAKCNSD